MYCYSKNSTVISIVLLDSSVVKELSICSSFRERQGLWLFERSCPKGVGKQITGERRTAHSKEGLSSFLLTTLVVLENALHLVESLFFHIYSGWS